MSNLIRLTVEPHVEIFINFWYGKKILLSEDNPITALLKSVFRPFDKVDPSKVRPSRKYDLGGWIDIIVSDGMLRKHGGYICGDDIKSFSKAVDLMIKQDMYRWCHHPNSTDKLVDYNIRRYIEFYNFYEDDITFDNLKRWYYRNRERREKRKVAEIKEPLLTIPLMIQEIPVEKTQFSLF
ncbi:MULTISPECIES: hypothetical protein [Sphingobacterium]|uniref:Uncharacterized protein n=1 Tax=Sphingobacterium populi TaxID=1812824 RepID=A0ABW5U925_9SPHI|nr:hypothetical protein [Sphingobacterium sp. CFCC 11742]